VSELWDRLATELRFLDIAREEARRTIHCEPHRVDEIRAYIDGQGAGDYLTVVANPACPAGQMLIFDDNAIAAAHEQFLQSLRRQPWRFGGLT
jgi:hypothetical protein